MEIRTSHNLPSGSWRTRITSVIYSKMKDQRTKGALVKAQCPKKPKYSDVLEQGKGYIQSKKREFALPQPFWSISGSLFKC